MKAPSIVASTPASRASQVEATLPGVLYAALIVVSAAYIGSFLIAALFRVSYPFPLQLTEGAALRQVQRILQGQPLYVAPTFDHVPLIYGPVYFYAAAALASVSGLSFAPLRLLSLVASIGSIYLVGRLVQRETGSRGAGLVAAGLLAAAYPLSETALDLGRVDALFVFFLVAGSYLAYLETWRSMSRWPVLLASGLLIGLAGLTKLPTAAAPVALALTAYLLVTGRGRAMAFVGGCIVPIVLVVWLLRVQSGVWPTWYVLDLPRLHEVRENFLGRFWFSDILPRLALPLLLGPVFLIGRAQAGARRPLVFYGLLALALIGLSWASRSNSGGATNVLLPAHVLVALLLGLGLHETLRQIGTSSARSRWFRSYVLGLCVVQFGLIAYNPRLMVPYRSDQLADQRLGERLGSLHGRIFAPDLDAYVWTSDKGEQPHMGAVEELLAGYGGIITDEGWKWRGTLEDALKQRSFQYVVLSETECCLKSIVLGSGYVDAGPLFPPDDEFWRLKTVRTPEVHVFAPP